MRQEDKIVTYNIKLQTSTEKTMGKWRQEEIYAYHDLAPILNTCRAYAHTYTPDITQWTCTYSSYASVMICEIKYPTFAPFCPYFHHF